MANDNHLKEDRATFNLDGMSRAMPAGSEPKIYRAKIFKSGNSVALRLPKALGLKEGSEVILTAENGKYTFTPVGAPKRKIDISGFAGKAPGIRLAPREDFEERPSTIAARKAAEEAAKKA
ncbi:AbrB/MazE/SpoVT family DNA-binding domain-containing protein [Sphingorhabdus arenilitoris]|uniref:AbrB/MazE/SpoVT family DNA-binding domain-containing protein n=1 Tax=Sphingorhabdus arenilitoris TaxID=1490041 RepID=A0ABV8RF19_9SPHN